ncbi:MAG: NAD(P)/FAD-dependent oxidoreductase [Chitinophagaceae bacterium]|nr:MAG: NAD(P)/FAD-dependent oxidoreductase [Chitinophagaceae bacterium]
MENKSVKRVVVVGGGFAGINLVKTLSKDERFIVTLVDINNYHFFPPLLYQVATAFIEPSNISYPFRRLFQKKKNQRFFMGTLTSVNPAAKTIETDNGTLGYDYLVLCVGTEPNYFGLENVRRAALPMKTINDSLSMRNHLLMTMEKAVRATSKDERDRLLNIVIAGGGPTGVEIAGMLAELGRNVAVKEYPEIESFQAHIHLVDSGGELLGPMSTTAQKEALRVLTRLGVHVRLNVAVKDYVDHEVVLADGGRIPTDMLIWTSGVIGREIPGLPKESIGRGRRVLVDQFSEVNAVPDVFALGDIAMQTADVKYPNGHPQLAQVAIQGGQALAKNLIRRESGREQKPFRYHDKGSMAIISKFKAVADLPKFSFKGFFAWVIWLFIHIIPLIGFRNKVKLAFSWLASFITNDPTLRLIIGVRTTKENKEGL